MMGRALLTVGWLATIGLILAGLLGYRVDQGRGIDVHLLVGLAACFLLLFSHTWIMFYLIGTGKAIRDAVEAHDLPGEWVVWTREYKNRSYPPLMLAMALAMATFILGGGVQTRVLPGWVHWGLFYVALTAQLRALLIEQRVLTENRRLLEKVDRALKDQPTGVADDL
jgi:hypothetical protein